MAGRRRVSNVRAEPENSRCLAFAKALNKHLVAKGWSQTELAKRTKMYLPKNSTFGRHNISVYCRGVNLPNQVNADAIAKALGITASELAPDGVDEVPGQLPNVKLEMRANSRTWLKLDMELPTGVALQIAELVNGVKEG